MFQRGSGVLLHISSLPSEDGIGDLGRGAYEFVDILVAASQRYWQVLPLNPTHSGGCNSPYFSASAIAGNPLLISLEKLEEQITGSVPQNVSPGFNRERVHYSEVTGFKYQSLDRLYQLSKLQGHSKLFHQFCREQSDWLDDYALFMVLKKHFNEKTWNFWPEPLKYRQADALDAATEEHTLEIDRQKWYQFVFFSQWVELKSYCIEKEIKIIGDIPIYVSYDSVDVWTHPENFKLDGNLDPTGVSGVPPDYFSATGQLWNNPVYNWEAMERTGFEWWVGRMQRMFKRFDIVRIDHFRGLVHYWEVPSGSQTAMHGTWMPVPTFAFFDTLQCRIPGFPVIAEDLGIITDDVTAVMDHYRFPGMKVLLFAFGEDKPLHPYLPHMYTRNCIVYTGTHDNITIRGWFETEADEAAKRRFFDYIGSTAHDTEKIVWSMIRIAESSVADCAIIAAQDLLVLGADCRMNTPSTIDNNWQWRMTPKQMQQFPVKKLAAMTMLYGR